MLRKIHIEGFKSIVNLDFEPGRVNLFIGPNGSGKSNILEGIGVLGAAASGRVDDESLLRRGVRPGVPRIYKASFKGSTLLPHIEFRAALEDGTVYELTLNNPLNNPQPAWQFKTENLHFSDGTGAITRSIKDRKKYNPEQGLAALKAVELPPDDSRFILLSMLRNYSIYNPNTLCLRGLVPDAQMREPVGLSGGGLPEAVNDVIVDIRQDKEKGKAVQSIFSLIDWAKEFGAGYAHTLLLSPSAARSQKVLVFSDKYMRDTHKKLTGYDASEGALYVLYYATLVLHSKVPLCFAIDNFDQALNPRLVSRLMERFCEWTRMAGSERQVFITAQNPAILDGLDLKDPEVRLFVVDRNNHGHTTVRRIDLQEAIRLRPGEEWTLSRMWLNGKLGVSPMSSPSGARDIRVGLVVEGPTDEVFIESALTMILGETSFVPTRLQPEHSVAFGFRSPGWGGVYKWCKREAKDFGGLAGDRILFSFYDILIVHLDADVAGKSYQDIETVRSNGDGSLPCEVPCPNGTRTRAKQHQFPCPSASATCNALRSVLLSWCNESSTPSKAVIFMPSKNTETWVMAALFPNDKEMKRRGFECHPEPETRLGQQKISRRIRKSVADYRDKSDTFRDSWPKVKTLCAEAGRFESDVRKVLGLL